MSSEQRDDRHDWRPQSGESEGGSEPLLLAALAVLRCLPHSLFVDDGTLLV